MGWIHDRPEWPRFTWDDAALTSALADVRHRQGRHLGTMEALGFDVRAETSVATLTDEVVRSSAIEGEHLDPREVRSSVVRRLGFDSGGLPSPGDGVEGAVAMTLDATRNFDAPLTAERLHGWHAALFPTGRSGMARISVGAWRTDAAGPMQVVSGPVGRERVHFQAPAATRLEFEMQRFLEWFATTDLDPVLKAGVAHFWFVTIHPFDDGNGRIGRAVADMALAQADGTKERFYSMSKGIATRRAAYYRQLEAAQRGDLDITAWLLWFLGCLGQTIRDCRHAAQCGARQVAVAATDPPAPAERAATQESSTCCSTSFQGHLTTSKYAKLARCSNDTALRDIRDLLARAIIVRNPGGGRSTSYRIAEGSDRGGSPTRGLPRRKSTSD